MKEILHLQRVSEVGKQAFHGAIHHKSNTLTLLSSQRSSELILFEPQSSCKELRFPPMHKRNITIVINSETSCTINDARWKTFTKLASVKWRVSCLWMSPNATLFNNQMPGPNHAARSSFTLFSRWLIVVICRKWEMKIPCVEDAMLFFSIHNQKNSERSFLPSTTSHRLLRYDITMHVNICNINNNNSATFQVQIFPTISIQLIGA